MMEARNFAVLGAAGFVAPRHLRAIRDAGHRLVLAMDPSDTVGVLDQYGFDVDYVRDERELEGVYADRRRRGEADRVHWTSVCSPNDLHATHVELALRSGSDVLCEKPLVIDPRDLDALESAERRSGRRVFTVLQLRLHPGVLALAERLAAQTPGRRHRVVLRYVAARGLWYRRSWKGAEARSGGVALNIGIHLFDLLLALFGEAGGCEVSLRTPERVAGRLALERADVDWFLSVDAGDLPPATAAAGRNAFRELRIDDEALRLDDGFGDLHTVLYERTLTGRGFGIADARPAVELAHRVRTARVAHAIGSPVARVATMSAPAPAESAP